MGYIKVCIAEIELTFLALLTKPGYKGGVYDCLKRGGEMLGRHVAILIE